MIQLYRNDYNGKIVLKVDTTGNMTFEMEVTDCSNNWKDGAGNIIVLNASSRIWSINFTQDEKKKFAV